MSTDIIIPAHGIAAIDFAVRAVFKMWPSALVADAKGTDTWGRYGDIPFAGLDELLCWRDDNALMAYVKDNEPSPGTIIHLLLNYEGLTVVIDSTPTLEMTTFVEDLQVALRRSQI